MNEKYYTVEQVSELLHIHTKTIQRYIREGKLRGTKVGKGWRISGHDLSIFMQSNDAQSEKPREERTIMVSSVIDIAAYGAEDAIRIMNTLTSVLNSKPPEFSKTSMQSQYIENENIVRVTLWGDIHFMSLMIGMIMAITE